MALLVQHGYGKSDKIERGFSSNCLSGVILSPKDETPDNMVNYVNLLRNTYSTKQILFDPQFYVSTLSPVKAGKLVDYPYCKTNLTRKNFISSTDISTYVKQTIDFQLNMNVTHVLSPTVYVGDFNNQWGQVSLSLAQQSVSYISNNPEQSLLISLCIDENAFKNLNALNEYLDVLSLMDVQGFYITVARNQSDGNPQINPEILEGLMYMGYSLATLNEFEVYFGYTSFLSIPLHAVGVTGTACGWYNTLKRFLLSHFQPGGSGGRHPRSRYTSSKLLNSILVVPELDTINRAGLNVLSNTSHDRVMRVNPANAPWPADISCLHHWETLSSIIKSIEAKNSVTEKLDYVTLLIQQAQSLFSQLNRTVVFETNSNSSHLRQWMIAINNIRGHFGV
jgi:hypothetical protein